jgi:outer membrane protein OmpU
MGDSVTFTGSGELDNGFTASVKYELDGGNFDDEQLKLDMGDLGEFAYGESNSGYGIDIASNMVPAVDTAIYSAVGTDTVSHGVARSAQDTGNLGYKLALDGGAFDDEQLKLDMGDMGEFAYGESNSGYGIDIASNMVPAVDTAIYSAVGTDTVSYGVARSAQDVGNLGYKIALDGGITLSVEAARNTAAGGTDNTYGVTYTGIDGLTLAAGTGMTATGGAAEVESTTFGAKYATGGLTFGLQLTDVETEGTTENEEGVYMGVTYNVNDDFTIGYLRQETDFSGTSSDEEHSGIQASYSMGSISFSGRVSKLDNAGGSASASDEDKHITMSIAF